MEVSIICSSKKVIKYCLIQFV